MFIEELVRFIHVLGAVAGGYYIVLPFLLHRFNKVKSGMKGGYVNTLFVMNRIGQYILILQLLSGGYLISKKPYEYMWIIIVIAVFLAVAAVAGIMSRPMKKAMADGENQTVTAPLLAKAQKYSLMIAVGIIVLVALMSFPIYR